MTDIHPAARGGFATAADAYVRGRPDYPEVLVDWLKTAVGLGPGQTVLDLGAGTGKSVAILARTGAQVWALEPVAEMRARLARVHPDLRLVDGDAEAIDLPDASLDAVVCAQAFHWFANRRALAEIRRVLRPGGRLGLVWNERDEAFDWVARISALQQPLAGDTPRYHSGRWREPFEGVDPAPGYGPIATSVLRHEHVGPPQQVIIDRFLSVSFIAAASAADRAAFQRSLEHLIATHPALRGRGTIHFPYQTFAHMVERL